MSNITIEENVINVEVIETEDRVIEVTPSTRTVVIEDHLLLQGPKGEDGIGVPEGGTTGQSLVKASDTDYDTEWSDIDSGLWEADGLTTIKPKDSKKVDASHIDNLPESTYTNAEGSVIEVGGIEEGTTFNETTFGDFVDMLLYPELFGTLTIPSRTFTSSVTGFKEVGEVVSTINFNSSFNRGSINPQYESATPYRSGDPNQYIYTGTGLTTVSKTDLTDAQTVSSYTVLLGSNSWTGRVAYDIGPQPKGSKGTNFDSQFGPGTTAAITRTITGVYPYFGTTVAIDTLTKQSLQAHGSSVVIDMVAEDGVDKQCLEVPQLYTQATKLEQYNTLSGAYDEISLASFTESSITKDINGNVIDYYKYLHNGGTIGARRLRWTF